jgi:hypothetical protein
LRAPSIRAACCASLFCLLSQTGRAAPAEKLKSRVTPLVSGYDTALIEIVSSCLTQELKTFRDVSVVEAEPAYFLRVMVIENKAPAKSIGYTLSVVVTRTIEDQYLRQSVPDEARLAFLLRLYGKVETIADSWILTASPDELNRVCRKIVETFYWQVLAQARGSRRRLGEVVYDLAPP